jgi:hypothetical protein
VGSFFALGWLGTKPVEEVHIFLGQLSTAYYFFFIVIICSAEAADVRMLERNLRLNFPSFREEVQKWVARFKARVRLPRGNFGARCIATMKGR